MVKRAELQILTATTDAIEGAVKHQRRLSTDTPSFDELDFGQNKKKKDQNVDSDGYQKDKFSGDECFKHIRNDWSSQLK